MKVDHLQDVNKLLESIEQELDGSKYKKMQSSQTKFAANPFIQFFDWFRKAVKSGIFYPHGMSVATATPSGIPSVRMILLKGMSQEGFVFFSHYTSRKGKEVRDNPYVSLMFYWNTLHKQIRIEGKVEKLAGRESDMYFSKRSRYANIVVWASNESEAIPNNEYLKTQISKFEKKFREKEVPRPKFWGGYLVKPHTFEFWEQGPHRLHTRVVYTRHGKKWEKKLLAP